MTRQLEERAEEREAKRRRGILEAVEGGLEEAVGRAGGEYVGFSARGGDSDCLLVIKAVFPAGAQVAFCGAPDLGSALIKAAREARRDKLHWRADLYGGKPEVGG